MFDRWRDVFSSAGFNNPILVATHSDITRLVDDEAMIEKLGGRLKEGRGGVAYRGR